MARRLVSDAKIVLERVGYKPVTTGNHLCVELPDGEATQYIPIVNGTVDNRSVVGLLNLLGYNQYGRKQCASS